MTDVSDALEKIDAIHGQLVQRDIYRGWRPLPVAVSGVLGLAAAAWASSRATPLGLAMFVWFWLAIAALSFAAGSAEIAWRYVRAPLADRRRTHIVLAQFLPALAAGACISIALARLNLALVVLLPGVWALSYGVGVLAARPFLPTPSALIGTYYCAAGVALLWFCRDIDTLSPWLVGGPFGAGQFMSAGALWWTSRHDHSSHSHSALDGEWTSFERTDGDDPQA